MPESQTSPVADAPAPDPLAAALHAWRVELSAAGGPDRLTHYEDLPDGTLDLASAHPSGLAMFLAGRTTRLSSLFREPAALSDARRRTRAIRLAATSLAQEHGLRASHLAVGMVTWEGPEPGRGMHGPVLLRPITLSPRGAGHTDDDLQLGSTTRANPALIRLLKAAGRPLDPRELEILATSGPGFDPTPAFQRLAAVAADLPGFSVRHRLVVGTFVDLAPALVAELDRVAPSLADHEVVRALAGDPQAVARSASAAHTRTRGSSAGRGLEDVQVLPLDRHQRAVLQAVADGGSVRVEAPPGTGGTQVLAAVLAALAAQGRRTLLVAGQQAETRTVVDRLETVDLADIVQVDVELPAAATERALPDEPRVTRAGDPLDVLRRQHRALHDAREPWGVSALGVMHELARLTSGSPAPRTNVRLSDEVLHGLGPAVREEAVGLLREAAELGAFSAGALDDPWYGADLADSDAAATVLDSTERLAGELLPRLRADMARIAAELGLAEGRSVAELEQQLRLLTGVRATLDRFTPAVYERPVTQLVAATAPARWRADRGVRMGRWERRRWVRQARDLVRPGCPPGDLHAALVAVQEQQGLWRRTSVGGGWPRVPAGLAAAESTCAEVVAELRVLEKVLAATPDGGTLVDAPLARLQKRLDRLAGDNRSRDVLTRRSAALARLRELGLQALVDDLARRSCPAEQVRGELELAWWRSLLQLLLGQDHDLARADAAAHELALDDARAAERRRYRAVARRVEEGLRTSSSSPCVATSPLALPQDVPSEPPVDVVVLAGAHRIGVAEGVLALARARQVVVIGDPAGLPPTPAPPAEASVHGGAGQGAPVEPRERTALLDMLDGVLPTVRLRHQHRMPAQVASVADAVPLVPGRQERVPAPSGRGSAVLVHVADGTGTPDADGMVESVDAEVDRVVALVMQHARERPHESLAVLTPGRHHARRIADWLRSDLPDNPDVAQWLARATREPFVVTDADRAEDAVRDVVIVSLGVGLTHHGRVLHRFGRLDAAGGDRRLAVLLTRARRHLQVVSCVRSDDLDPERLRSDGARALRAVLSQLERASGDPWSPGPQAPTATVEEPLLVDLVRRLAARGEAAVPYPGASGPDLVVPRPGADRPVAVVSDLAPLVGAGPVTDLDEALAERHLMLPDQLVRFGWRVTRVPAVGLFTDPDEQVRRVLGTAR